MEEWQTPALYSALLLVVVLILWRWHTNKAYENFCLLHIVADRDGFLNNDKMYMAGAFIVSTFAVVVVVIRNAVTFEVAAMVAGYASLWAVKQAWQYTVTRRTDADVRTAEIERGRKTDAAGLTVEEMDAGPINSPRRRRTDSLFGKK